ncbi:PQ-loop-domain-containing protein [Microthyrium microscopicum]|uniref:PQ-loop-domain-containing protein n=1 Tax=Microthyrium microscopicum TaxID=703497 RepID=A0A6A6UM92_9PEZI|nr:PQ-loop-domain-containing protein [Microthyrium microscopicum]
MEIITAKPIPLTWNEALSGIFGSISLAAWIFLLVPQLIENYRLQSADGISLVFLSVWFLGDITNLLGASWAHLVPTVIALAVYFCFADCILIMQCVYYNRLNAVKRRKSSATLPVPTNSEHEPLLSRQSSMNSQHSASNLGLPGSHQRRRSSTASSTVSRRRSLSATALGQIVEEEGDSRGWLKNSLSVIMVCVAGAAGWALAWRAGVWKPVKSGHAGSPGQGRGDMGDLPVALGAQVLGYASAVCYLGARIPQIVKNQREKSCEGLSLLFFILSLLGNATYGAGILFHSLERDYVLTNLPWLIGSIGTIAEDAIIFVQFHTFKTRSGGDIAVTA